MADEAYTAPRQAFAAALQDKEIDREWFLLPEVGGWFTAPPR